MDSDNKKTCPHQIQCGSFFAYVGSMSEELNLTFRKMYCHGLFNKCARAIVVDGGKSDILPVDLMPNQEIRARSLVQEDQKLYS
jgi:hypothetical protein